MKNSDKNMLLVVVVAFVAIMTLGGLGNAAYKYDGIYWVPFTVNPIIFFLLLTLCNNDSSLMMASLQSWIQ